MDEQEKMDKQIMVVKRDNLFAGNEFQGFCFYKDFDFENAILENFEFMKRSDAEKNTLYKQPIVYLLVINPTLKKIFAFQRSSAKRDYAEQRLYGKWSIGIGGHIEKCDIAGSSTIYNSMLRELEEEINISSIGKLKIIGFINDDSNDVGKVHFGIVYVMETDSIDVSPNASEMITGRLVSVDEFENICLESDVEKWSRIMFDFVKKYLNG